MTSLAGAQYWFGWKYPSLAKDQVRPRGGFGSGSPLCDGQITQAPASRALGCCSALLSWLLAHGAAHSPRVLGSRSSPKHSQCKGWKNKQLEIFPGESIQASQMRSKGLQDLISSHRKPTVQSGNQLSLSACSVVPQPEKLQDRKLLLTGSIIILLPSVTFRLVFFIAHTAFQHCIQF